MPQTAVRVLPTRTLYEFSGEGTNVALTFMTASLPMDLDLLSRPVTYLTWDVRSTSGAHEIELFFAHTAELVVNTPTQEVVWSKEPSDSLDVLRMGSKDQPVLARKGDDLRIDWGYLYMASPQSNSHQSAIAAKEQCLASFTTKGRLPESPAPKMPRPANQDWPVAASIFKLGKVGTSPVRKWLMLAYDDQYSIQYFRKNLRPYWRRNGAEAADLLRSAASDYSGLQEKCRAFDQELMSDLERLGGETYATLGSLAYRQAMAANKLAADANGQPLLFPKENFSNGCIATVDVIYPMAPLFLLTSPSLTKAMLVPVLDYAASPRWKFPFAPHDLGTYPLANGQVYGGGERTETNQMPVEETGNMLLLLAALAKSEGKVDFMLRYWPLLEKWADYLKTKGFDPENQLCTDDFAGHLAHNVNLSAKAITALGAFALLCEMKGDAAAAAKNREMAREFAARWIKEADDGDHYRLAFDKPGTWSQKYNLVWDRILGLGLFPPEVLKKEMAYYRKVQDPYGLALDNRKPYTKLDWISWTATLTGSREDFDALLAPVLKFLNETPDRVPMTDWYWTQTAKQSGFQARSVVGGVFLRALYEGGLWQKWAHRDRTEAKGWAAIPPPPVITPLVPTSESAAVLWRYATTEPAGDWMKPEYNASGWQEGPAGFGATTAPGATVRTEWKSPDIWLRRQFKIGEIGADQSDLLNLLLFHDDDAEIYINGILAGSYPGNNRQYEPLPISAAARASLVAGENIIAIHCHQIRGGQFIDVGLALVR